MTKKRVVDFEFKTIVNLDLLKKKSDFEQKIVQIVLKVLNSSELEVLKAAYISYKSKEITIDNLTILYEEDIPCDNVRFGMTLFPEHAFALFCSAFKNKKELIVTLLHELHRLHKSASGTREMGQEMVTIETKEAFTFSNAIYKELFQ